MNPNREMAWYMLYFLLYLQCAVGENRIWKGFLIIPFKPITCFQWFPLFTHPNMDARKPASIIHLAWKSFYFPQGFLVDVLDSVMCKFVIAACGHSGWGLCALPGGALMWGGHFAPCPYLLLLGPSYFYPVRSAKQKNQWIQFKCWILTRPRLKCVESDLRFEVYLHFRESSNCLASFCFILLEIDWKQLIFATTWPCKTWVCMIASLALW